MKTEILHILLSDYCSRSYVEKVKELLEHNPTIDIMQADGKYFTLAVARNSPAMLKTLIEHYEKTKLQGDSQSTEHKIAKEKLLGILEDAGSISNVSPEIREILDSYLNKSEGTETDIEADFAEFDDLLELPEEEQHSQADAMDPQEARYLALTEENLRLLDEMSKTRGLGLIAQANTEAVNILEMEEGLSPDINPEDTTEAPILGESIT